MRVVRFLLHLLKLRYVLLILLILGAWRVYNLLRPGSPFVEGIKHEAARRIADRVVEEIMRRLSESMRLLVRPVAADPDGRVFRTLQETLRQRLGPRVVDRADEATHVLEATVVAGPAEPTLEARLLALGPPSLLWQGHVDGSPARFDWAGLAWRGLAWMAVVGLLPLATAPLAQRVLAVESNGATFALLAAYILAAAGLALALAGFDLAGPWGWLVPAAAAVVSTPYFYRILSVLEKQRL